MIAGGTSQRAGAIGRVLVVAIGVAVGLVTVAGAQTRGGRGGGCATPEDLSFRIVVARWREDGRQLLEWRFATSRPWDLDGDGVADAVVPRPRARQPEHGCPDEVVWEIHASGGGCDRVLGTVEGELPTAASLVRPGHHGLPDLVTTIRAPDPSRSTEHLRYEFDGTRYVERSRTHDEARCDVHPADCEDRPHVTCELRDHPAIPGSFDADAVIAALSRATEAAQARCRAPEASVERCDVHPTFAPDGRVVAVDVRDCPLRRACVAPFFEAIRIAPFVGEPSVPSTSFQIPAP